MSKTLPPLPDPKYIWHDADEPGEADLFEFEFAGAVDNRCDICERLYTAEQMQAYAIAAIEAQGVPDGWKPIETAPESMDECVVVGWLDDDGSPRTEFDYKEDGCWIKWHEHAEHTEVIGGHGVSYAPPYTHWLKLPPLASVPPAPQAKPQPLSDEQIDELIDRFDYTRDGAALLARAVEQAHGIKGE